MMAKTKIGPVVRMLTALIKLPALKIVLLYHPVIFFVLLFSESWFVHGNSVRVQFPEMKEFTDKMANESGLDALESFHLGHLLHQYEYGEDARSLEVLPALFGHKRKNRELSMGQLLALLQLKEQRRAQAVSPDPLV